MSDAKRVAALAKALEKADAAVAAELKRLAATQRVVKKAGAAAAAVQTAAKKAEGEVGKRTKAAEASIAAFLTRVGKDAAGWTKAYMDAVKKTEGMVALPSAVRALEKAQKSVSVATVEAVEKSLSEHIAKAPKQVDKKTAAAFVKALRSIQQDVRKTLG